MSEREGFSDAHPSPVPDTPHDYYRKYVQRSISRPRYDPYEESDWV
jgi:hypothetical protein